MRHLVLDATILSARAPAVFDNIAQFHRYPALAPHVQSTTVHEGPPSPIGRSSWELHFRSGLLRWNEQERFLREHMRLEFEQTAGDFEELSGFWSFEQRHADTSLSFHCQFDFGIPSLEGILDPIAERVITETVAWVIHGMFDETELGEGFDQLTPIPAIDQLGR